MTLKGYILGIIILALVGILVFIVISDPFGFGGHYTEDDPYGSWHALWDVRNAAIQYKIDIGTFPTGNNREITLELSGNNSYKKNYLNLRLAKVNKKGELTDPRGVPYGFENTPDGFAVIANGYSPDACVISNKGW